MLFRSAVLLLVAILSITVVGKYVSAPENHQKTIASLDEKKQTVMELTQSEVRLPTLTGVLHRQSLSSAQSRRDAILKVKPAAVKGQYLKSITLTSTMGPGVKVNPMKLA